MPGTATTRGPEAAGSAPRPRSRPRRRCCARR
jgi:hypothetical protein